jgi:hypothetical protein
MLLEKLNFELNSNVKLIYKFVYCSSVDGSVPPQMGSLFEFERFYPANSNVASMTITQGKR